MEMELQTGSQSVWFDRDATVELYRGVILTPGADECTCIYCKNFRAQRGSAYPQDFLDLLGRLGIDPLKEWEAFGTDFGRSGPDRHLYGGWFLFCGKIVQESTRDWDERPFSWHFTDSFPKGTLPAGMSICAVEFLTSLRWILPESPD